LGPIFLIFRFWSKFHPFGAKIILSKEMQKVAPRSLKVVRGIILCGLGKISQAFLRLRNVKFGHFLHFPAGSKVNWRFKAKKVAFRERNRAEVEKLTFCIPQSQKSLRDFSGFLRFPSRNLAQTNAFTNISLDVIILTLEKC
jgi:hypothetical protein